MQRLEISGAVRPLYGSLGVKGLSTQITRRPNSQTEVYRIAVSARISRLYRSKLPYFSTAYYPNWGLDRHTIDVSRSHTNPPGRTHVHE